MSLIYAERTDRSSALHEDDVPLHIPSTVMGGKGTRVFVNLSVRRWTVRMHTHDYYELAYIRKGRAWQKRGAGLYEVQQNDLIVVNPVVPHGYVVADNDEVHIINIDFLPEALGDAWSNTHIAAIMGSFYSCTTGTGPNCPGLFRQTPADIGLWAERMLLEQEARADGYEIVLDSLLRMLLITLCRCYHPKPPASQASDTRTSSAVTSVIPHIHQIACEEDVSVRTIAQMAGLSYGYFGKQFKEIMGETVLEYIQRIRAIKAAELLSSTDMGVDAIAGLVGYRDISAFRATFKRVLGITPSEYRLRR